MRIGQRAFECVILAAKRGFKCFWTHGEHIEPAGIVLGESGGSFDEVEGRAAFAARFGEDQRAVREIERRQIELAGQACPARLPVQAAGDHQVDHKPQLVLEADRDPFAQAAQLANFLAGDRFKRRLERAKHKGTVDPHSFEFLPDDSSFKCLDIDRDVGQFGHAQ